MTSTHHASASPAPDDRPDPRPTTGSPSPLPPLWRDPLLWACAVVATLVYLPHGFDGYLTRDLALYAYAGQQFAEGVPPYLGVVNRAGPLAHALPGLGALGARAMGIDDVLGMRLLFMLFSVAAIAASYVLGRAVFRSRVAGLASAGVLLCIEGFISYATYGPREKTPLVLFCVLMVIAMAHRRWATTGLLIALATLTWQPVFLPAIAGAVVAAWVASPRGRRLGALVRIGVGGFVPTALVVGSYVAIGELQVFLDDFLVINARYTDQISLMDSPLAVTGFMVTGYGPSGIVFLLGLGAALWLAVRAIRHPEERDEHTWPLLVATVAVLAVGVLFALKAFNGFPDAFFLLPWAQLGVAGVVARLSARSARAGLVSATAVLAVTVLLALVFSLGAGNDTLAGQRADVDAVMSRLPEDARIVAVEAPQPLVLTQQRNPTRYQLYGNGLIDFLDETWPGGREGHGRDLLADRPEVVALGSLHDYDPSWIRDPMGEDYEAVGTSTGWTWYLRTDLGEDTLAEVADALQ